MIFPLQAATTTTTTLHPPTRTTCLPGPGLPLAFSKRGVCAEQLSCQSRQQCEFCFPDPLPARPPPPSPSEPLSLRNSGQRDDGWRRSLTGKYSIEGVRCAWGHNERIQPGAQYSVSTLRWLSEPPRIRARKKGRQRRRSTAGRPSTRLVGNVYTDRPAKLRLSHLWRKIQGGMLTIYKQVGVKGVTQREWQGCKSLRQPDGTSGTSSILASSSLRCL